MNFPPPAPSRNSSCVQCMLLALFDATWPPPCQDLWGTQAGESHRICGRETSKRYNSGNHVFSERILGEELGPSSWLHFIFNPLDKDTEEISKHTSEHYSLSEQSLWHEAIMETKIKRVTVMPLIYCWWHTCIMPGTEPCWWRSLERNPSPQRTPLPAERQSPPQQEKWPKYRDDSTGKGQGTKLRH